MAYREDIAGCHATEGRGYLVPGRGARWWGTGLGHGPRVARVYACSRRYRSVTAAGRQEPYLSPSEVLSSDRAVITKTRADRAPSAGDLMPSARRLCARTLRGRLMPPYPLSRIEISSYPLVAIAFNPVSLSNRHTKAPNHSAHTHIGWVSWLSVILFRSLSDWESYHFWWKRMDQLICVRCD